MREMNISSTFYIIKNLTDRSRPVGYFQTLIKELNSGLPSLKHSVSERVKDLIPGPLDYNNIAQITWPLFLVKVH